jgi:hypothetical protein
VLGETSAYRRSPLNSKNKPPPGRPVDRPQSTAWQRAARPATTHKAAPVIKKTRGQKPWEVIPEDLACLDSVRSLLSALNDAYASTARIQTLIADIPVLAARCVRRIGQVRYDDPALLARALTDIGNMGLERELLSLLEDLTMLQADLQEAQGKAPTGA